MTQFYDPHIFMCTNRRPDDHPRGSCGAHNAEGLRQYLRDKLKQKNLPDARANMAGCMDQCELGPVLVIYPEGVWYAVKTTGDIDRVVEEHIIGKTVVTDLQIKERIR